MNLDYRAGRLAAQAGEPFEPYANGQWRAGYMSQCTGERFTACALLAGSVQLARQVDVEALAAWWLDKLP